jgi:hypothetical protein
MYSLDITNDTTHYKIVLRFNKKKPLEMLETSDKMKIKKSWVKIKTFLEDKIDNF